MEKIFLHFLKRIFVIILLMYIGISTIGFSQSAKSDSITINLRLGWNMISIPVDGTYLKNDLFPSSISSAYFYDPDSGSYLTRDTLVRGKGYWLKFPSSETVVLFGDSSYAYTIDVKQGWNMIGSISKPIPVSTIKFEPEDMITSPFFTFENTYEQKDTVDVGSGYWIKVNQNGKLILSGETIDTIQHPFTTNSLEITNLIIGNPNTTVKYRMITFDIQWDYSWRTSTDAGNWDAAWIFIKFRVGNGEWKHATLSTVSAEHTSPPGSTISAPPDGKGVYLYRSENGSGHFHATNVLLKWNYGLDNVADDAELNVKVLGLEMVYIPEGSFYVSDNGASDASLIKGSSDYRPWFVIGEGAIEVTNTPSNGYYYRSSKDIWNDVWNAHEDVTGSAFTIPADFPKGFRSIYCMKYEMTQQQYVDFLNTLTATQASNRHNQAKYNMYGYTIKEENGVFSTTHPNRACGFLSPADSYAFADWCALRPMTELEFEKICRGSGNQPVNLEFVWGTTYSKNAVSVQGSESDREYLTNSGANSYYLEEDFMPQFPLNAGIFATPGKSREKSGATYYGVLEMGTNLAEPCVSIGNSDGRVFTYRNGDGQLSLDGFTDESNWPLRDGQGGGYRGGCFAEKRLHMCTSLRVYAALEINYNHRHIPFGFRGVRTISNLPETTVTDIDGNVYKTIKIGNQVWMAENLKTTKYHNGETIPNTTDDTAWGNLTSGAYCNYNNNSSYVSTYGRLYNWYAVNDNKGLAPEGWHVPSDAEWMTLINYLGGVNVAGGKLKESGIVHWRNPNTGATNVSGFTALPGGFRGLSGTFGDIGVSAYIWSATEDNNNSAWFQHMNYSYSLIDRISYDKYWGFSVRCIKD